ncbi:MAG TPA: phospholipase C, phosphocholine-specific, partial [Kofleriaceae bacterium]|nr:phospholipase C, phosphocholine-specific [Kofleriaceae bacterium]
FIRGAAALAAFGPPLLSEAIRRAAAIPAASPTGSIRDVEHVVVLMMENRSFDHYFGTFSGARGFGDPRPAPLYGEPGARPRTVFHQPHAKHPDGHVLPYPLHPQPVARAACFAGLPHDWGTSHEAVNRGRADRWAQAKSPQTMAYYQRADLPFHAALADAFTLCDAYHCSLAGPTRPNRMFLMTGTNGQGRAEPARIDNGNKPYQLAWTTYPERLQQAGISWQLYQNSRASGRDTFDASNGGLNALEWFPPFDHERFADSALVARGNAVRTLADLRADVTGGRLAQVVYLTPPWGCCEHPQFPPAYGAVYLARVLDALTADPAVWSRTALLIMYDENDGFFDHVTAPMPPAPNGIAGASTVATEDEIHRDGRAFGLGARVPMTVVSPWSRGGWVCSQVFDHTSVIRFLEARFGVAEPNISAWRRAVCGDLTSAFDFRTPHLGAVVLPDTTGFIATPPETKTVSLTQAPAVQASPAQQTGTRPARPLPYALHADARVDAATRTVAIAFANRGTAGAVFQVHPGPGLGEPRHYTVEAGKALEGAWVVPAGQDDVELTVLGPNGFFRCFRGQLAAGLEVPELTASADPSGAGIVLTVRNRGAAACTLAVRAHAYGAQGAADAHACTIAAGASGDDRWDLAASHGWYDLAIACAGRAGWAWRYAGHVEGGAASITDPAMGGLVAGLPFVVA